MKKVFKWIGNVLLGILVIIAIISVITLINSKRTKDPIPTIGNYKFMAVLSNSMNPTFRVYDMIIDKKVPEGELKKGDVISFKEGESIVTHRIVEVQQKDGKSLYKTKGDANNVEDERIVPYEDVVAKYVVSIPYMGLIVSQIKGPIGIGLIWLIFMYIIIKEVLEEVKSKKQQKKEKEEQSVIEFKQE